MSHLHESWKLHDLRSQPRNILIGCKNHKDQLCTVWKGTKKNKGKSRLSSGSGSNVNAGKHGGSNVNAGEHPKHVGKGGKSPLPTDICWRCGKPRHQEGQPCKTTEAVCRNCGIKGHYEKVCMKKSTHLVDIPDSSNNSDPDYFNEFGEPVYVQTHMVHAKEIHKKKHLIQFPISVNLEKVRKPVEGPCAAEG